MSVAATAARMPAVGSAPPTSPCLPPPGATSRFPGCGGGTCCWRSFPSRSPGSAPPRCGAFTEDYDAFRDANTEVLPISVDSIPTLREFKAKERISVDLLSDFKREVSRLLRHAARGPVPLQPRLHPDRPRRHRPLGLRGGGDPQPPGERRAARADPRARLAVPPHQGARCAVSCSRPPASARQRGAGSRIIPRRAPAGTKTRSRRSLARYARGLDRRDWDQVRSLFWRNGTYSGPLIPRSAGNPVSDRLGPGHLRPHARRSRARVLSGAGPANRPPAGGRPGGGLGDAPAAHAAGGRGGRGAGLGGARRAATDRIRAGGSSAWPAPRCREEVPVIPDERSALALVGIGRRADRRRLDEAETTLAAVTDALRQRAGR